MKCADVMTKDPAFATPADTARDTARRMRALNVNVLPVCDALGRLVGTVSDRDMVWRLVANDHPATTHIREVMSPEYVACLDTDETSAAARCFAHAEPAPLLVTDAAGRLCGTIAPEALERARASHRATG
jgi:CBS domain-containing protein